MLDFTSSLYLGFRHPSGSIPPWRSLTPGTPAALFMPQELREIARQFTGLQECERGLFAPSTLHLFLDVFGILAERPMDIYLAGGTYAIAGWGVERAAAQGAAVHIFPAGDTQKLYRMLAGNRKKAARPVIVSDGYSLGHGSPSPIGEYLEAARSFGGVLVLDDTQALGIFGSSPSPSAPYGKGGGGTLCWSNTFGPEIIVISSLAKAFGVPIALLSGSADFVKKFESESKTRVHCSQPSAASVHAAGRAFHLNRTTGDVLRLRIAALVSRFRNSLSKDGLSCRGGLFPMQTLEIPSGVDTVALHERILKNGIKAVLHKGKDGSDPCLSFIITSAHSPRDIDRAVEILGKSIKVKPATRHRRDRPISREV